MVIICNSGTSGDTSLGSVPKDLEECLNLIGLEKQTIPVLQKTVLLNTCHILRHYVTHSAIAN